MNTYWLKTKRSFFKTQVILNDKQIRYKENVNKQMLSQVHKIILFYINFKAMS